MNNKVSKSQGIELIQRAVRAGWKREVSKLGVGSVCVDLSFSPAELWKPLRSIQIHFRKPLFKGRRSSVAVASWSIFGGEKVVTKRGWFDASFQIRQSAE